MSFDWHHYLNIAQYIKENAHDFPDAESCYRTTVSRAYYAAFCLARNYVRDSDGKIFYGDDHQALQDYLKKNIHNQARVRIGNRLRRLHQDRKKSDYHDNLDEKPINKASKALTLANKIVNGLVRLS